MPDLAAAVVNTSAVPTDVVIWVLVAFIIGLFVGRRR
jgi:hypothetical protein